MGQNDKQCCKDSQTWLANIWSLDAAISVIFMSTGLYSVYKE